MKTSDVHTYPATIPDQEIIYLEYVSLALSVIDKLNIEKGEHVAQVVMRGTGIVFEKEEEEY